MGEKMKIAIVDDEKKFAQIIETEVQQFFWFVQEPTSIQRYNTGKGLLEEMSEKQDFDIYFLDIEMPGLDGLEVARRIRRQRPEARIVFITNYDKYAVSSYKVRASYYVLKSSYEDDLSEALHIIWEEEKKERKRLETDFYIIGGGYQEWRLSLGDIAYLTKDTKYVVFHCYDEKEYKERTTLEVVLSKLSAERFVRIDKGCVVNMKYVCGWKEKIVTLRIGDTYIKHPVSRRLSTKVASELLAYWRRG